MRGPASGRPAGKPLHPRSLPDAIVWIDTVRNRVGALNTPLGDEALKLVRSSPEVDAHEIKVLDTALPEKLARLDLPRPCPIRQARRAAKYRKARMTLGRETAHDGPHNYGAAVQLPTLTLRFVYDR